MGFTRWDLLEMHPPVSKRLYSHEILPIRTGVFPRRTGKWKRSVVVTLCYAILQLFFYVDHERDPRSLFMKIILMYECHQWILCWKLRGPCVELIRQLYGTF